MIDETGATGEIARRATSVGVSRISFVLRVRTGSCRVGDGVPFGVARAPGSRRLVVSSCPASSIGAFDPRSTSSARADPRDRFEIRW